jgi:hypothetical protein
MRSGGALLPVGARTGTDPGTDPPPCSQQHPLALYEKVREAGCAGRGSRWAHILSSSRVAVVAYNPQHYNGVTAWWESDLRALLPQLQRFAQARGKVAILAEPFAAHFPHGSYWQSDGGPWPDVNSMSPQPACCGPILRGFEHNNFVHQSTRVMRRLRDELAPDVRILPLYNATLPMHAQHKADSCSYSNRKVRGVAPPIGRSANASELRVRSCCDCLHYCYSPGFFDEIVFTPLHGILKEALAG